LDGCSSITGTKASLVRKSNAFKYIVYVSDLYFESFLQEEWDDFDAEKRQKMREDLSTAIDDHMSGNNASGRSLIAQF
jgi:NADPH-dependent 7-cyano-7-deazaguanine reductase QueF-like protein